MKVAATALVDSVLERVSTQLNHQEIERARLAEEMYKREQERLKEVSCLAISLLFAIGYWLLAIVMALLWLSLTPYQAGESDDEEMDEAMRLIDDLTQTPRPWHASKDQRAKKIVVSYPSQQLARLTQHACAPGESLHFV